MNNDISLKGDITMTTFEEKAEKIGMTLVEVKFNVTSDVYNELNELADENDSTLDDFMRQLVDFFIEAWYSDD